MSRAAGDDKAYRVAILDAKTGKVREELSGLPSVSTITGETDGTSKDAMSGWGFNLGIDGMMDLLAKGRVKAGDDVQQVKRRLYAAKAAPWQQLEKAADRGNNVHDFAEKLLQDRVTYDDILEELPAEEQGYGRALIRWHEQYQGTPLALERTLVSLTHAFAGTVDLIDRLPGMAEDECRVADYKTSKSVYESQFNQGNGYVIAWEDMTKRMGRPMRVTQVSVIRFAEDGTYEQQTREPDREGFLLSLALYNHRNKA